MNDIFVDDLGEGHAFIFVHGFLGSSEMWSLQKDYFKSKYRIVSPALPGFGESHKAPSLNSCLLYTSPSPRDRQKSRMPSSA